MLLTLTKGLTFLMLVVLLSACGGVLTSQPQSSPTSSLPTPTFAPYPQLPTAVVTGEILRLSGDGPFTSEPFKLEKDEALRVSWQQSSKSQFILSVVNADPALKGDPSGKVTFEFMVGPSFGNGDYKFKAGSYVISVDKADGPWEVWVQVLNVGE